jgi:hypothetical protein
MSALRPRIEDIRRPLCRRMRSLAFLPTAMGPVAALQKAELVVGFRLI